MVKYQKAFDYYENDCRFEMEPRRVKCISVWDDYVDTAVMTTCVMDLMRECIASKKEMENQNS